MRILMSTTLKTATISPIPTKVLLTVVIAALFTMGCSRQEGTVPVYASAALPECTIATRLTGNDIVVKVTVANHSQSPYRLLEWNLPKNGEMTTALFQVTRDGAVVEYKGRMVKRQVNGDSYITISPGGTLSAEVPLRQGYDVQAPGQYAITYKAFNQRSDSSSLDTLTSNTAMVAKQ